MDFVLPIQVYEDSKYNDLRRGYLILIASLINDYLIDDDINNFTDMIIAIEKSCYDHSVEIADYELLNPEFSNHNFNHLYRTLVIRITKNLDHNSEVGDEHLATNILNGSIDPSSVSKLDNKTLSPMNNEKLINELTTRMNQVITLKTSTLYRCRKCGKRETQVRSVQLRSTDEGENISCKCVYCGYAWVI
jgi:DNA-directed RNA polymerase subunit M/transcription elongation factor TFIIS